MYSRREFGQVILGGSIVSVAARTNLFAAGNGRVGATTASFRDLPRVPGQDNIDDVIRALRASGVRDIELSSFNVEPAGPNSGPAAPPKPSAYPPREIILSPEEIAAAKKAAREDLRRWRVTAEAEWYGRVREKFDAAGIVVHTYAVGYDEQFTDEEIQATFRQAAAFGAKVISFPASLDVARRLMPFGNASAIGVALRNSIDFTQLSSALALSPNFRLALDIGNLTGGNRDAVAAVREYQLRISHILVRDRLRNDGRSEKFGNGDTPIAEVLGLLKELRSSIPVFVDYDYAGLGTSVDEVLRCTQYVAQLLD